MLFSIYCLDGPNATAIRPQWYTQHKAYVAQSAEQIAFAGPLLDAPGGAPKGSLLVIDFADVEAVNDWLAAEPFNRAGVYSSVQVNHFANYWTQRAGFPPQA